MFSLQGWFLDFVTFLRPDKAVSFCIGSLSVAIELWTNNYRNLSCLRDPKWCIDSTLLFLVHLWTHEEINPSSSYKKNFLFLFFFYTSVILVLCFHLGKRKCGGGCSVCSITCSHAFKCILVFTTLPSLGIVPLHYKCYRHYGHCDEQIVGLCLCYLFLVVARCTCTVCSISAFLVLNEYPYLWL